MKKLVFGLVLLLISGNLLAATWIITFPRPLGEADHRTEYPVKLIALALDQTGVNYQLVPTEKIMLQDKALKQLADNRTVNVVWSMTDKDREERLLPIRIPIYKGLIGWRVFLIKQNRSKEFQNINNLQSLIKYKPIQGFDWPDTKILQSNGFDVYTSKTYKGLFTMLSQKQGDFLPRSLVEVWPEYDSGNLDQSIVVESTLGVRYPTAMYFFVNKNNKILARILEDGLEKAIANGKFDELFRTEFTDTLKRTNMGKRFFFEIENPLLPEKTPIGRKELWY
ncbi:amino acid ABC transporter substrate-binding protein [Aliiglaciecola sp. LCG003]|uniref:amino acid ABC transporter substrate-binding protein n=1 Tax=Aliiglaciecola sp. LCG003 TaxID=3053655 RepID=UPI0025746179|nr:amino acid ABC transporter substrate-binding protein [Aliiglaciecola sp. LCG003]WJG10383.1 amino acid ABC transporter substrate-binding protein [Aliiglaciecola sp. LCG003]